MAASRGSPVWQARCGRIRVVSISETIRRDAICWCLGARVSAAVAEADGVAMVLGDGS